MMSLVHFVAGLGTHKIGWLDGRNNAELFPSVSVDSVANILLVTESERGCSEQKLDFAGSNAFRVRSPL